MLLLFLTFGELLFLTVGLSFLVALCYFTTNSIRDAALSPRPRAYLFGQALLFGGMLNFIIFWNVSVYLGGDAWSGKIEDGEYFVCSHGKYSKVTEDTWRYSYAHVVSNFITFPLALIGGLIINSADVRLRK